MKINDCNINNLYVFDKFYPKPIMDALYMVAKNMVMPPSVFFIEFKDLHKKSLYNKMINIFPVPFVNFLLEHIERLIKECKIEMKSNYGFEIWIGNSGNNSKTAGYLHVDNDELYRMKENIIKIPLIGSILYLTPSEFLYEGETIFLDPQKTKIELFKEYTKEALLKIGNTYISKPIPGNFVIFKGNLPHAVLPFYVKGNNSRVNLMVNIWNERIFSVPKGITFLDI